MIRSTPAVAPILASTLNFRDSVKKMNSRKVSTWACIFHGHLYFILKPSFVGVSNIGSYLLFTFLFSSSFFSPMLFSSLFCLSLSLPSRLRPVMLPHLQSTRAPPPPSPLALHTQLRPRLFVCQIRPCTASPVGGGRP